MTNGCPCWFCRKIISDDDRSWDCAMSREFDTPVHRSCIKAALEKDPYCDEALLMASELLSFNDGMNHGRKNPALPEEPQHEEEQQANPEVQQTEVSSGDDPLF